MVLNGNGIGPADPGRNFDADRYKNVLIRASQDVASVFRVGLFGYYGKEVDGGVVNTIHMVGPDVTLSEGPVELNVQYLERHDENATFSPGAASSRMRGAFAELIYTPAAERSNVVGVVVYNWLEGGDGMDRYHTLTGHVSFLPARNLRLLGEYTYDFSLRAHKLSVGFVSAF
jgi:hypothetical protein